VLYAIEKRLRDARADHNAMLATRSREAVPQLTLIKNHLDRLADIATPRSPLG